MLDPNASYTGPLLYPLGFYHVYIHADGCLILIPLLKKVSSTLSSIYPLVKNVNRSQMNLLGHYMWEVEVRGLCSGTFLWYEWFCQLPPYFPVCFICKRSVGIHNRAQEQVHPAWQLIQRGQLLALSTSLTGTSIFWADSIFNLSLLKASCMVTLEVGRQVCDLS